MNVTPQDVLTFWFDEAGPEKWFKKDPAFDEEIRERFGTLIVDLCAEIDARGSSTWEDTAEGALALTIALDQFPRNIHRQSAGAFACDAKALDVAKRAIAVGYDLALEEERRRSFYMPFMHSEDLKDQDLCVTYFTERISKQGDAKWAIEHREIIERFGCFPHRNEVLGRETTQEQQEFLDSGGFAG